MIARDHANLNPRFSSNLFSPQNKLMHPKTVNGSFHVMNALGLFDVKGLTDLRQIVQLGSPLFKR
jgi:hypothetical protein